MKTTTCFILVEVKVEHPDLMLPESVLDIAIGTSRCNLVCPSTDLYISDTKIIGIIEDALLIEKK